MKKLVQALGDYADEIEEWAKRGIAETTMIIYSSAVANAPVDTSFLKQSIDFMFKDGGMTGVISVGAEYAVYVEFGTGIYATQGSRAKKIPWVYQSDSGEWVTTYGQPPHPFWFPALDAGEKYFREYFS